MLQGTGKVLNAIATGLSRALGWIPGPTRWLGARVADAQRWANERVVKVKTWTGWKSIHDRIRHDSKPVRYIQMFARAIFTGRVLRIFIGGLPAPVKFLAGVAAALVTSPKWARDEAKARWQEAKDRVEARRKAREAQNGAVLIDTTASVNGTATKVNTPEGVAAEAAAAAADQEAARQREISEAEQRKAVLESSLSTVVDNAIDFYTRPQEYKGPSAMENLKRALQKAVTPGYHPVLPSQQVHKAARAFAEDVAVRFHSVEGTGQPEDDDNNPWINLAHPELPKLLREIAQRYFEEFDTPPPARKARAATAGRR